MSAELLRRAAVALRQHAQAASSGPWSAGDEWDGKFLGNYGDFGWVLSGPAGSPEFEDSEQGMADARYVALLGPPVALALADALEAHAEESYDDLSPAFQAFVAGDTGGDPDPMVTLARAILREQP